jgi:hypothetical protein
MREHLDRRLRYLWTFELFNGLVWFPLLYYFVSRLFRLGWFSLVALVLVCAILLVGTAFWCLKGQSLRRSTPLARPAIRRFFSATKIGFGILVALQLALFAVRAFVQSGASGAELLVGGALSLMAVLEYVNYYFYQLMYDNRADLEYLFTHRRLKRAVMVRDLGI